jgi:hypothetical protein
MPAHKLDLTVTAAQNWKRFVADYLVWATRTKEGQFLAGDKRVSKKGGQYVVSYNETPLYAPMTAESLYDYIQRSTLYRHGSDGDALRIRILEA